MRLQIKTLKSLPNCTKRRTEPLPQEPGWCVGFAEWGDCLLGKLFTHSNLHELWSTTMAGPSIRQYNTHQSFTLPSLTRLPPVIQKDTMFFATLAWWSKNHCCCCCCCWVQPTIHVWQYPKNVGTPDSRHLSVFCPLMLNSSKLFIQFYMMQCHCRFCQDVINIFTDKHLKTIHWFPPYRVTLADAISSAWAVVLLS